MQNKINPVESYQFVKSDRLFLDTNVWVHVFGLSSVPDRKTDLYSAAFKRILDAGCEIYIDRLVIVEFVRVCSRIMWSERTNRLRKPGQRKRQVRFKEFRKSREFRGMAKSIERYVQQILKYSDRIEIAFEKVNIGQLIREYRHGRADFSDLMFRDLCRKNDLILVTDDSDFETNGIVVLTANTKLLAT